MTESGGTKSFLGQLSSVACLSSQLLETGFVPSLPSGTVWDSGSHQQTVSWGKRPGGGQLHPQGIADTALCTCASSHTSAWLVDFPCGFANAAD